MLRALVASYARRTGCAVVIATTSFADAAALCSEAVVLRAGEVSAAGTIAELRNGANTYVAAMVTDATIRL